MAPTARAPKTTQKTSRPQPSTASRSEPARAAPRTAGPQTSQRNASSPMRPPRPTISRKRELTPHGPVSDGPSVTPSRYGGPSSAGPTPKTNTPGMTWESEERIV